MSKKFDVLDQILMKICLKNDIKIEHIYEFYASGNHHHVDYAKVGILYMIFFEKNHFLEFDFRPSNRNESTFS